MVDCFLLPFSLCTAAIYIYRYMHTSPHQASRPPQRGPSNNNTSTTPLLPPPPPPEPPILPIPTVHRGIVARREIVALDEAGPRGGRRVVVHERRRLLRFTREAVGAPPCLRHEELGRVPAQGLGGRGVVDPFVGQRLARLGSGTVPHSNTAFSGCHCTPQMGSPPRPSIVETNGCPARSWLVERRLKRAARRASPRKWEGEAPLWWLFIVRGCVPAAAKSPGSMRPKRRLCFRVCSAKGRQTQSVSESRPFF